MPGNPPIRALCLDLDDTLWSIWPTILRAERLLHDWLACHHPRISAVFETTDLRELCRDVARLNPELAHDLAALRKGSLRLAADRVGLNEFCEHTAYNVFQQARNEVECFPDVLPSLTRLQTRYRLAALSNGSADLEQIGIGHFFTVALNPSMTGTAKPDPTMYLAVCETLALTPEEVLHIGDDPELDVLAAARLGMRTAWVNREGRDWPGGARPDIEVRSLLELERRLRTEPSDASGNNAGEPR